MESTSNIINVSNSINASGLDATGYNYTGPPLPETVSLVEKIVFYTDYYIVPCIILTGLMGNTLSFFVFVLTNLKKLSSSVYLAALAVSDSGFLICVFFSWSTNIGINVYNQPGWCQMFVYLTYVFGFLSVWYIVAFSCERFIAVRWPFKRSEMCTPKKAKIVVISLAIFAVIAYLFAIWTSEVASWYYVLLCIPKWKYRSIIAQINTVDSIITLVIPFISILFFNIWIIYTVKVFTTKRQQSLQWQFKSSNKLNNQESKETNSSESKHSDKSSRSSDTCKTLFEIQAEPRVKIMIRRGSTYTIKTNSKLTPTKKNPIESSNQAHVRVTTMLLAVSSVFILLNLPSHVLRMYDFFHRIADKEFKASYTVVQFQKLFTYVYYINFSINFLLYNLCGKNFRAALKRMVGKCWSNLKKIKGKKSTRVSLRSFGSLKSTTKLTTNL